ncbi:MAG: heme o synthase, partial [Verrucomicrobiota bacterium]
MNSETLQATAEPASTGPSVSVRQLIGDSKEVIKMRLTALVLLTTLVGYYMGSPGSLYWLGLLHVLFGTGLVAASAAALNQYLERDADRRMERTADRPLAAERLPADEVVVLAVAAAFIGIFYLATVAHVWAGVLAGFTFWLYLGFYTPLKRRTAWNTLIGAVPGALPPVIGYAAATGRFDAMAVALFGLLFFWQLPHFLAIAWLYRADYDRAGFVMVTKGDTEGVQTGTQAFLFALALVPVSLLPWYWGEASLLYLVIALCMGIYYTTQAWFFMLEPSDTLARKLFIASILYLP